MKGNYGPNDSTNDSVPDPPRNHLLAYPLSTDRDRQCRTAGHTLLVPSLFWSEVSSSGMISLPDRVQIKISPGNGPNREIYLMNDVLR